MAKRYRVDIDLNSAGNAAAAARAIAALAKVEAAKIASATRAAAAQEKAAQQAANAQIKAANQAVAALAKVEAAAARAAASQEKAAQRAEAAATRAAAAQEKSAQRAENAQTRAANQAANAQTRAAQQAANAQARAAAQVQAAQQRAANQAVALDTRVSNQQIASASKYAAASAAASQRAQDANTRAAQQAQLAAASTGLGYVNAAKVAGSSAQRAAMQSTVAVQQAALASANAHAVATSAAQRASTNQSASAKAAATVTAAAAQAAAAAHAKAANTSQAAWKNAMLAQASAAKAVKDAGNASSSSWKGVALSLVSATAAVAVITAGMRGLLAVARAYADAMKQAHDESRRMAAGYNEQRDSLRELASIRDIKPEDMDKFTKDVAAFNVTTGMKHEEGVEFQKGFYASGSQFIGDEPGKHMTSKQGPEFMKLIGQYAVANGIDLKVAGEMAGKILSSKDYSKMGAQGPMMGLKDYSQTFQILKRGSGENKQLLSESTELMGSMLSEDISQGIMSSPQEVATMISVMAEVNPGESETLARRGTEGLRDLDDDKAGPLLKRAKILRKDKQFEAAAKLEPVLKDEAKQMGEGTTVTDVLNKYFEKKAAKGISAMITSGLDKGLVKDRTEYAKQFEPLHVAPTQIAAFQASGTGAERNAQARMGQAETAQGAANSELETLRKQTLAYMKHAGLIDKSNVLMNQYLLGKATFQSIDVTNRKLIDTTATSLVNERVPESNRIGVLSLNEEAKEGQFRNLFSKEKAAGRNALTADPMLRMASIGGPVAQMPPGGINQVPIGVQPEGKIPGEPIVKGSSFDKAIDTVVGGLPQLLSSLADALMGNTIATNKLSDGLADKNKDPNAPPKMFNPSAPPIVKRAGPG